MRRLPTASEKLGLTLRNASKKRLGSVEFYNEQNDFLLKGSDGTIDKRKTATNKDLVSSIRNMISP